MSDPGKAVFLSYAHEDTDAAKRIADALRAFGMEVWFDQNELRGGDTWDGKIRHQIKSCALFVALISQRTEERSEGYFRLEWKLAAERTHLMAEGMPFIMPVAIGDTPENGAAVPAEFLKVQWTRLGDGLPTTPFIEQVRRLLESPRKPAGTQKPTPAHTPAHTPAPVAPKSGFPLAYVALGIVVVALIAFIALRPAAVGPVSDRPSVVPTSVAPVADAKSVAVLPFVNLSGDKEQDYFSDGLTEEILNALARERDLRVPGSASSFSFKGKDTPPAEIARALNVTRLVEGSVRKAGTRVRISVKLTRASDGFSEELGTFTEEVSDIFALQDKVARAVVERITGRAATNTVAVSTKNAAAYDAYLRGRAAQTSAFSARTSAEAVRFYEEALRLDPDYALAWARLAETCVRMFGGFDSSQEMAAKARAAVATALRLDPNLPEAHLAQARIRLAIDHDLAAARSELDAVERLRPGEVEVPAVRAQVAYADGQWGDTLAALIAHAVEADPQNADALMAMAQILTSIGRFADAERLCDRATAAGGAGEEIIRLKHLNLHAWTGDTAAALALLETTPASMRETNPRRFYPNRASYRAQLGDPAGAIADYERWRIIAAEHFANRSGPRGGAIAALYRIARIENQLGRTARATQLDDQALAEIEKYARDFPGAPTLSFLRALILAHRGQSVEALALMEEANRFAAGTRDVSSILGQRRSKAGVLAALGRIDDAVAELRAVHEAGYAFGYSLRTNEDYAPLRGDARFQKLMAEAEALANAQPRPKK